MEADFSAPVAVQTRTAADTNPRDATLNCLAETIPITDSHRIISYEITRLERTTEDDRSWPG